MNPVRDSATVGHGSVKQPGDRAGCCVDEDLPEQLDGPGGLGDTTVGSVHTRKVPQGSIPPLNDYGSPERCLGGDEAVEPVEDKVSASEFTHAKAFLLAGALGGLRTSGPPDSGSLTKGEPVTVTDELEGRHVWISMREEPREIPGCCLKRAEPVAGEELSVFGMRSSVAAAVGHGGEPATQTRKRESLGMLLLISSAWDFVCWSFPTEWVGVPK